MSNNNLITGLNHVSLLVTDLQRASNFYLNVLRMEEDSSRPEMAFPGMWIKAGTQQIHLLCFGNSASGTGAVHPGRDAHCALSVISISRVEELLKLEGIPFHMSKSGRQALFCRDPDGNGIEFVEVL